MRWNAFVPVARCSKSRKARFSNTNSQITLSVAGLLLAASTAIAAAAAPTLVWKQTYDGPQAGDGNEAAQAAVRTANNDFIVGGYALDSSGKKAIVALRKYSASGSLLWSRQNDNSFDGNSSLKGLTLDASGNVVAVIKVALINSLPDLYLASYSSADGSLIWDELYPSTSGARLGAFTFDAQGNVFTSRSVQNDILLTKYSGSSGAVLWEKLYSPAPDADDSADALAITENGDLLLTGRSDGDFLLARLATADGAIQWEHRIPNASGSSVAVNASDDVFVSGTLHSPTNNQIFIAKFSVESGDNLWQIQSTNSLDINDAAGPLFLDDATATVTARQGTGIYVLRVDQVNGALRWERHIPGDPLLANWPINGATGSNGDLYLFGLLNSNPYLAKLAASDGTILWASQTHQGSIAAIVPDQDDNVLFVGTVKTSPPNTVSQDFYVAKLAAADGSLLWSDALNTPSDVQDHGLLSALDSQGNVIVTGRSGGSYYTVKYANTNGDPLWAIPHSELADGMATDANGKVILSRSARDRGTLWSTRSFTAKYNSDDGALQWEKDFGSNFNFAWKSTLVDSSGNIIVAASRLVGTNSQIYVAQLSASDGSVQWETQKTGQISASAGAVAIDSSNNVFIGGSLDGQQYSAKLSATDGSILWERIRTNEPGAVSLITAAMIDPAGNLVTSGQFGMHILTTKSRSSDGTPIWEAVRRDPRNGYPGSLPWSMSVDSQGSVAIVAVEQNITLMGTIYVAKYGVADGSVIWDKTFGVSSSLVNEYPAGTFADEAGNLVVGVDDSSPLPSIFYLAKFRSADGAVMWEHKETPLRSYNFTMDAQGRIAIPGGWQDGITVLLQDELPVQLKAPTIDNGVLRLSWPESLVGVHLEKTPLANGFSATAAWTEAPTSSETNSFTIPINPQSKSGFFRLVQP